MLLCYIPLDLWILCEFEGVLGNQILEITAWKQSWIINSLFDVVNYKQRNALFGNIYIANLQRKKPVALFANLDIHGNRGCYRHLQILSCDWNIM